MNNRSCGLIFQHSWELSYPCDNTDSSNQRRLEKLKNHFLSLIKKENISHFAVSMELGFPLDAASCILDLSKQYPLTLECVIPFEEQHISWPEEERNRYFSLIEQCDKETLLCHHFSLDCYQQSIRYLISECGSLMIVWNGSSCDAGDAIRIARQKRRNLFILNPAQFIVQNLH